MSRAEMRYEVPLAFPRWQRARPLHYMGHVTHARARAALHRRAPEPILQLGAPQLGSFPPLVRAAAGFWDLSGAIYRRPLGRSIARRGPGRRSGRFLTAASLRYWAASSAVTSGREKKTCPDPNSFISPVKTRHAFLCTTTVNVCMYTFDDIHTHKSALCMLATDAHTE